MIEEVETSAESPVEDWDPRQQRIKHRAELEVIKLCVHENQLVSSIAYAQDRVLKAELTMKKQFPFLQKSTFILDKLDVKELETIKIL